METESGEALLRQVGQCLCGARTDVPHGSNAQQQFVTRDEGGRAAAAGLHCPLLW